MKCIIVDDEPIARKGIKKLLKPITALELVGNFSHVEPASLFLEKTSVELIFLDINMPGINGIEFARTIPKTTLIIFTTAYSEYAVDSYEVDAIDYLVKPIDPTRFRKAVEKASTYHHLLLDEESKSVEKVAEDYIFVRSNRRYFKINLADILFIEGLKDYLIFQLEDQQIITRTTIKKMQDCLPKSTFIRVNRSYIVNKHKIDSFDHRDVFIKQYEIAIGNLYHDDFFQEVLKT